MKKVILFDLDGVLINSKKNMEISWKKVNKEFNLNKSFDEYFQHIGRPFKSILRKIKIKKVSYDKIYFYYNKVSNKNINKITIYKNVKSVLSKLKKKYLLGVVTSKDRYRTNKVLKKFKLKFNTVECPSKKFKGKPSPSLILKSLNKLKASPKNCIYIGDMPVDYMAAKKAKVNFVFSKYGYYKKKNKYSYSIKKISQLPILLNKKNVFKD